jgi:hypothetical protein
MLVLIRFAAGQSLPSAMKYRYWRTILWMEVISLPGCPFRAPHATWSGGAGTAEDRWRQGVCRCRRGQAMTV